VSTFDPDALASRRDELERAMSRSDFWDDQAEAADIEELITIAGRDGRPQVVCAGAETWWERDERKALAKSRPVVVKSFEI
jgi:hypothetical protein